MKLKLFGKKDKSASVPENAASAEVEEQDNSEGSEGAESESGDDSSDEKSSSDDGNNADDVAESEASQTQLIEQINACTTRIEQQDATIANLQGQLKKLNGDRSKEIDQAASKKSVQQTAAQGVPADEMPEAEGEGAIDEPKTYADFMDAYNSIEDPEAAGKYYAKWNKNFGQK